MSRAIFFLCAGFAIGVLFAESKWVEVLLVAVWATLAVLIGVGPFQGARK